MVQFSANVIYILCIFLALCFCFSKTLCISSAMLCPFRRKPLAGRLAAFWTKAEPFSRGSTLDRHSIAYAAELRSTILGNLFLYCFRCQKQSHYSIIGLLPPQYWQQEGGAHMELLWSFLVAVAAGVVCHYVIKWLDGDK